MTITTTTTTTTTTPPSTCCATCRSHSTSCDRTKPGTSPTSRCPLSNRRCQGCRGFKLRWPRPNNRRRAVVCESPSPSSSPPLAGKISNARFVHMSNWDIELHHSLTESNSPPARNMSLLGFPVSWNTCKLKTEDESLLEYFCCVASASLATFGHNGPTLGNMLVRIAMQEMQGLGETGVMTSAVLQALLAFSSLHRYGMQSQALELKNAALRSLAEGLAAVPDPDANATMQHTAAGMLLCSFEVHQSSCASDQWTFYLGSVKTVLDAYASIDSLYQLGQTSEDMAMLLDWVHYFDVLARFSLLHSKREQVLSSELPSTTLTDLCSQVSRLPSPLSSMMNLLSEVCDTVSSCSTILLSATHDGHVEDFKGFLALLDWRIRSLPISKVGLADDDDDSGLVMQLYQLAILLFLNRSVEDIVEPNPVRMQGHIDKAFALLAQLRSGCKPQFPIYIIGCEAQTDEQRAIVLDVIFQTERTSSSRSWNYFRRILEATWAQDDLANGNHNMSYHERLSSVISQCLIIPSFV